MPERPERVDRQRLDEGVLEKRLEAGEALAAGAARVRLDSAAAVVQIVQHDRQVLCELRGGLGELVEVRDRGVGRLDRDLAGRRGLAQGPDRRKRGVGERREVAQELVEVARGGVEVREHRLVGVGGGSELGHRRAQLLEQPRQALDRQAQVRALSGGVARGVAGLDDEPVDLLGVVGERRDHRVRVRRQLLERVRVVGQQVEQVVGLGQRRDGPAQGRLQVARPARDGGAQLVDDQREALPVGQPHDVLNEVGGNRRLGVADGDRRPRLQRLAVLAGLAVDEVLADQRLRARLAEGVGLERAKPALRDLHRDERVAGGVAAAVDAVLGKLDRLDLSGADAGDLEIGAGDEAERVVELDLVRARRGVVVRRSAGDHDERADGEQDRRA